MNLTRFMTSCLTQQRTTTIQMVRCLSTSLFSSCNSKQLQTNTPKIESGLLPSYSSSGTSRLLTPSSVEIQSVRTYIAKEVLRLRCSGCYFEKRLGRLYVECTLKPRHKQMKKMPSGLLYRDDYSKGHIRTACWWKYRDQRYNKQGNTKYTNFNWLGDRLGKEIWIK